MIMPEEVDISKEHMKKLRDLANSKTAISQMMQMMQQQCENKLKIYNEEARKVWLEIHSATGIDITNIVWVPHPTETKIVPTQINLVTDENK